MSNSSAPWMAIAEKYSGIKELSGSRHNPVIVGFFAKSGHPEIKDDETAWCSAFVNAVFYEYGVKGTNNLMARSWLKWSQGEKVSTPKYGDVVIFSRGNNGYSGHVGFFVRWDDEFVYVLGGNQGNTVKVSAYPRARLLGFRRLKPSATESSAAKPEIPKITDKPNKVITSEEVVVAAGGVAAATTPLLNKDFFTGLITIGIFIGLVIYMVWRKMRP